MTQYLNNTLFFAVTVGCQVSMTGTTTASAYMVDGNGTWNGQTFNGQVYNFSFVDGQNETIWLDVSAVLAITNTGNTVATAVCNIIS